MKRSKDALLADAHDEIRRLRHLLDEAAQPLRVQLRETQDRLNKAISESTSRADKINQLEEQIRVQDRLIAAQTSYHAWFLSTGKSG